MRLPYVADPPPTTNSVEAAIVQRIQARRAPGPLLALDLALLHSPSVADGWNAFMGAVRTQTTLSADVRELVICRVAVVNRAWYEWDQHAPLAAAAGLSVHALDALRSDRPCELAVSPDGLDERQWLATVYADEMTRRVQVEDATFQRLTEVFDHRQIVDLTATVAAYNCVSRFLVALDGEHWPPSCRHRSSTSADCVVVGEKNGLKTPAAN